MSGHSPEVLFYGYTDNKRDFLHETIIYNDILMSNPFGILIYISICSGIMCAGQTTGSDAAIL